MTKKMTWEAMSTTQMALQERVDAAPMKLGVFTFVGLVVSTALGLLPLIGLIGLLIGVVNYLIAQIELSSFLRYKEKIKREKLSQAHHP